MLSEILKHTSTQQQSSATSFPSARLNAKQAGDILGFQEHDIPTLVSAKLLKPLGKPSPNSTKYFAAVEIYKCFADAKWLGEATQAIYDHWNEKNARKIKIVPMPHTEKKETSLAA